MILDSSLVLYNPTFKKIKCTSLVFLYDGHLIYTDLVPYNLINNSVTFTQEKQYYIFLFANTCFLLNYYFKRFYINYIYYGKFFIFENSYCNSGCAVDLNNLFNDYQISSLYGKAYTFLPKITCEDIYVHKFIVNTPNAVNKRTFSNWLNFFNKYGAVTFYSIFLKFKPEVNKELARYVFTYLYSLNSDPTTFYVDLRKKYFDLYWLRSHYFSIKQEKNIPDFLEMQKSALFLFSTNLNTRINSDSQLDAFIFARNVLNSSATLYDYPCKLLFGNNLALEYNFVSYQTIFFFFELKNVNMPNPFYELPKSSFWFVNYQLNKMLSPTVLIENAKFLYLLDLDSRRDILKSLVRSPLFYLYNLLFFIITLDILYFSGTASFDNTSLTSTFFFLKAFFLFFFKFFVIVYFRYTTLLKF